MQPPQLKQTATCRGAARSAPCPHDLSVKVFPALADIECVIPLPPQRTRRERLAVICCLPPTSPAPPQNQSPSVPTAPHPQNSPPPPPPPAPPPHSSPPHRAAAPLFASKSANHLRILLRRPSANLASAAALALPPQNLPGTTVYRFTNPRSTSAMIVSPHKEISSSPPAPCTTSARSTPSSASAAATQRSIASAEKTSPSPAPAPPPPPLSGPSKLRTVRTLDLLHVPALACRVAVMRRRHKQNPMFALHDHGPAPSSPASQIDPYSQRLQHIRRPAP